MANPGPVQVDDKKFQADYEAMIAEAKEVQADYKQRELDHQALLERVQKNPDTMPLGLLIYILLDGGDSMSGVIQDDVGRTSDQLNLNGKLTSSGNDLSNMVFSNDSDSGSLKIFSDAASKLLGSLSGDKSNPYYQAALDPNQDVNANPTMDPTAEGTVHDQLLAIRQLFNPQDPYNPPGTTVYFDANDSTKIQTFAEFQTDLGMKGDFKPATDAGKKITDGFSVNSQTTQTASAVLDNDVKTLSPVVQSVDQLGTGIGQIVNSINKTALNNMTSR